MSINQIQIKVQDLTLGMYVSGLDRPWSQTPYPLQGFYVHYTRDIENLKSYCNHVYIDVTKGRGPVDIDDLAVPESSPNRLKRSGLGDSLSLSPFDRKQTHVKPVPTRPAPIEIRMGVYETTV